MLYGRIINMSLWQIVLPEKSFTGKVNIRNATEEDCVDIYVVKFHSSAGRADDLINRVAELAAFETLTGEEKLMIDETRVAVSVNGDVVGFVRSVVEDGNVHIKDVDVLPSYIGKRLYVKLLSTVHSQGKLVTDRDMKQLLQNDDITVSPVCKDELQH